MHLLLMGVRGSLMHCAAFGTGAYSVTILLTYSMCGQ